MNKTRLLAGACVSAALLFSATAFAQSPGPKAKIFAKYDTNKNGVIDGDEIVAVRKAFVAEPKGEFATYDKDHDGKLSDAEIAEIKPPGGGGKKGGGKDPEKKKKTDTGQSPELEKKSDAK